ncbi:hypothetical protein C8F01DRAFT_16275 [Mycena amicta]|nr:hypothetical protein C8F01DRAFT_16275 [Mycena amicta]
MDLGRRHIILRGFFRGYHCCFVHGIFNFGESLEWLFWHWILDHDWNLRCRPFFFFFLFRHSYRLVVVRGITPIHDDNLLGFCLLCPVDHNQFLFRRFTLDDHNFGRRAGLCTSGEIWRADEVEFVVRFGGTRRCWCLRRGTLKRLGLLDNVTRAEWRRELLVVKMLYAPRFRTWEMRRRIRKSRTTHFLSRSNLSRNSSSPSPSSSWRRMRAPMLSRRCTM